MAVSTFILIIFISTSPTINSGAAGISQEFTSQSACIGAGNALADNATKRGNFVLSWGCFKK